VGHSVSVESIDSISNRGRRQGFCLTYCCPHFGQENLGSFQLVTSTRVLQAVQVKTNCFVEAARPPAARPITKPMKPPNPRFATQEYSSRFSKSSLNFVSLACSVRGSVIVVFLLSLSLSIRFFPVGICWTYGKNRRRLVTIS